MATEIWYRGEALGGGVSKAGGGSLHDLGEGVYYTSEKDVAKLYANTRANELGSPNKSRAYQADINMSKLRVLDLTKDARWSQYLNQRPAEAFTIREMIKRANENYARFFQTFLKSNKISLQQYDAVVGQEFVRGGKQLCLLLKNGQTTVVHSDARATFRLFYSAGKEIVVKTSPIPVLRLPPNSMRILQPNSRIRRAAGVQGAAAAAGVALGGLAQWLGDIGIERRIRKAVETSHADHINHLVAQKQGVLLIITLQEWEHPNDIGMRVRTFLGLYVQGGTTQERALTSWFSTPRLIQGSPKGWRTVTQYVWLPPSSFVQ